MAQIRISKTDEIEDILAFLSERYLGLSESEIVKLALAELYNREVSFSQFGETDSSSFPRGETDNDNRSEEHDAENTAEDESQANPALRSLSQRQELGLGNRSEPLTDPEEAAKEIPGVINLDEHR